MPHPAMQIVDVPLRVDQVEALMLLIEERVATHGRADLWAGPMAQLVGSIPKDVPAFRPGSQHWLTKELSR